MIFLFFTLLILLAVSFFEALALVFLWQAKEYRLDRLRAHWDTFEGKRDLLPLPWLGKLILLLLGISWSADIGQNIIRAGLAGILVWQLIFYGCLYRNRQLKIPQWTVKAKVVFFLSYFSQIGPASLLFWLRPGSFLFYVPHVLLPLIVCLAVILLVIPSRVGKKLVIDRAAEKMARRKNLKVVGITGSYGKTSTKEFVVAFLKQKYPVFCTRERENTLIGIAQRINRELNEKQRYFVVEMGAYQPHEISQMCALTRPSLAIVTALARQHLGLFGSFDRLVKAKMELIESVGVEGQVIANGDDERLVKEVTVRSEHVQLFSLRRKEVDYQATDIDIRPEKIGFTVREKNLQYKIEAPLYGKQNIPNLLAAIAAVRAQGVEVARIQSAAKKLQPVSGTMRKITTSQAVTIIDDSYNANPEGVLAAIEYLSIYPGKRWLVLQPMIELGKASLEEHRRVLKKGLAVCDRIMVTNRNYWPLLKNEFTPSVWQKLELIHQRIEFEERTKGRLGQKDVILFEGKESHKYLDHFVGHDV